MALSVTDFVTPGMQTVVPGVADAQATKSFATGHFSSVYLNGFDVVQTQLAQKNEGLISPTEMATTLRHIQERSTVPVIVDAESGFGNQLTTYFVARDFERSGAAGVVVNDQIFPSHTADQQIVVAPFAEFVAKLKAARDSFDNPQTLLFAELDGFDTYGFEGFKKRVDYLHKNQLADVVLAGHVTPKVVEQLAQFAQANPLGLVANAEQQATLKQFSNAFSTVFYRGVVTQARQVAEQQLVQQLQAQVEV